MIADLADLVVDRLKNLLIFSPEILGVKKDEAGKYDLIFQTKKGEVGVYLLEREGKIFFKFESGGSLSIAKADLLGKPN